MRKIITPYLNPTRNKKQNQALKDLSPSAETINNILQFAATHRCEKIVENKYVEFYLN
jgi:hypothetical protein